MASVHGIASGKKRARGGDTYRKGCCEGDPAFTHPVEDIDVDVILGEQGDQLVAQHVVEVDVENQRISLGMKQLTQDPWEDIDRLYKLGDVIKGKVARVAGYGAFIELEHEIDGLVHISQISEDRIEKVKDYLNEGEEVTARVIKIDKDERRIGLSVKAADYDEDALAKEVAAYDEVGEDLTTSLGDLLDEATAQEEE